MAYLTHLSPDGQRACAWQARPSLSLLIDVINCISIGSLINTKVGGGGYFSLSQLGGVWGTLGGLFPAVGGGVCSQALLHSRAAFPFGIKLHF